MVRRRWPDVVVVTGILAVLAIGIWAIWGDDLKAWWSPTKQKTEKVEDNRGLT